MNSSRLGAPVPTAPVLMMLVIRPKLPLTAGGLLRRRHLLPGSLVAFGSEHIHDVVNVGCRPALTIHVYSPRLRSMTF